MVAIRVQGSEINPDCPLCKKEFERITNFGEVFFVCFSCMVSINVKDPCVHMWDSYEPTEKSDIICPNVKCGAPMNFFFRGDGFMKGFCPRCKSSIATEELPARIDAPKYTETGRPYYDQ